MVECARCRRELDGEGRFNKTYGGQSHWACPVPAVWPPAQGPPERIYSPIIALRKMAMKEAFASSEAQAHIQALMEIVEAAENHPAQTIAETTTASPPKAPAERKDDHVEEVAPQRKRREPPAATPKTTPSPKAKDARTTRTKEGKEGNQQLTKQQRGEGRYQLKSPSPTEIA